MIKRFIPFFVAILFFAAACSKPAANYVQPREVGLEPKEEIPDDFFPRTYTITALGDSLTEGVGDRTNKGGYLPYLKEELEKEKGIKEVIIHNFGVRGYRTPKVLNKLDQPEVREAVAQSDLVMITTGGNDLMRVLKTNISHITVEDFRKAKGVFVQNLRNLVEKIRSIQPDAGICLIGLYNPFYEYFSYIQEFDDVVAEWNQASRTVLMEYENTYFVEIAEMFKDSEEELLFTDHFHPNNKGYELMALAAFSELKKNDALAKGSGSHLTAQQRESGGENE